MHPRVRRDLLRLARRPEGVFVNPFERGEVGENSPSGWTLWPDRLACPLVARPGISRL
jgi:hypothetical protein